MSFCCVRFCPSNKNTKVNNRNIFFFKFPKDESKRKKWLQNCQLGSHNIDDQASVCELHFVKSSFTTSGELKSYAFPSIFNTRDDCAKKRKAEEDSALLNVQTKSKKMNDDKKVVILPSIKIMDTETTVPREENISLNGSSKDTTSISRKIGRKIYRLIIQIDKLHKTPPTISETCKNIIDSKSNEKVGSMSDYERLLDTHSDKKPCTEGCKLRKTVFKDKPAFQCEYCDKYYISRNYSNLNFSNKKSSSTLKTQVKNNYICNICQKDCTTQMAYDKHLSLHVSATPGYPYKCHQCSDVFILEQNIKDHYKKFHSEDKTKTCVSQPDLRIGLQKPEYTCKHCNFKFYSKEAYGIHIKGHFRKEVQSDIAEVSNAAPMPNPVAGNPIGILRAIKFSCKLCSKEFDNVAEVDRHTRTHLEVVENPHKCNLCNKSFNTTGSLNIHLKHHLSRAHKCPICSKAFINRTTLKIHMRTHAEVTVNG
ncbi:telomere zinc finger-associated protein [Prorops nasuta]|uniref:telomere zinc finger-associated protein n=1 Tax=Prorops nasuta TaxID=863751 RepID=UPI0034CF4013